MKTISLKIQAGLDAKLTTMARQQGTTKSQLVRQAIEAYAVGQSPIAGSCLDLARDLAGCARGPADLSTNKKHLRGYGR
jgi:hypothetical protein